MKWIQCIRNYFYIDQFYKVTSDGDQVHVSTGVPYEYILHIHRTKDGLHYHFTKDSYMFNVPYQIIGMSVYIHNTTYILPPNEFIVQGNELFTESMTLWLCKHYLYIEPTTICTLTLIDKDVNIHQSIRLNVQNNLQNDIKYNA